MMILTADRDDPADFDRARLLATPDTGDHIWQADQPRIPPRWQISSVGRETSATSAAGRTNRRALLRPLVAAGGNCGGRSVGSAA